MKTNRYTQLTIDDLQDLKADILALAQPLFNFEWLYYQTGLQSSYLTIASEIDDLEAAYNEANEAELMLWTANIKAL